MEKVNAAITAVVGGCGLLAAIIGAIWWASASYTDLQLHLTSIDKSIQQLERAVSAWGPKQ